MGRPPSLIAAALARHGLAEVAQRTAIGLPALTGAVTVRCPMPSHGHPDRSPSMRLYLDDDHYYCFGCGARGDVLQWVRDAEGVGVAPAIRILDSGAPIANAWVGHRLDDHRLARCLRPASMAGQAELPMLDRTPPERVFAAVQAAWALFTSAPLHQAGAAYLAGRGVDIEVLEARNRRPEVGYTPAEPGKLVGALKAAGFSADELVDAGLGIRRVGDQHMVDFYRQRALIPLYDMRGRLHGIIGRNVGDARWAKYKNPPRTATYDKSLHLYQPLPAPRHPDGAVVVVEGVLDALAIAVRAIGAGMADRLCPITQSGRELSEGQLCRVLSLHTAPPVIAFDADPAGREATARLAGRAKQRGVRVRVASLPEGEDPASWLADRGPSGLAAFLRRRSIDPTGETAAIAALETCGRRPRSPGHVERLIGEVDVAADHPAVGL